MIILDFLKTNKPSITIQSDNQDAYIDIDSLNKL